jgi:hypothetical protein
MKRSILPLLFLLIMGGNCLANPIKNATSSSLPPHFGIFFHYLYGLQNAKAPWNQGKITSWDDCVNELDVNKIAAQVKEIGADYVVITAQQSNKYFCFPNRTYEQLTGYKRGEATSHRDLISDLYTALHKKGIKLFLYMTGDGPKNDQQASFALKNPSVKQARTGSFKVDKLWVTSWSQIIRSISLQYGKKISGWWFDGSYDFIGYNNTLLTDYLYAAKAGNRNALVAFNFKGPQNEVAANTVGNYTAGESDKFESIPSSGFENSKKRWHILSYLGTTWANPGIRYPAEYMSSYIRQVKALNGMVTIDVCLLRDGTIDPTQYNFLKSLRK